MKLLCECGHPNHVHFAGTGHCHATVLENVYASLHKRCDCAEFVVNSAYRELVRERKDTG